MLFIAVLLDCGIASVMPTGNAALALSTCRHKALRCMKIAGQDTRGTFCDSNPEAGSAYLNG
jgi:hypothetical protein